MGTCSSKCNSKSAVLVSAPPAPRSHRGSYYRMNRHSMHRLSSVREREKPMMRSSDPVEHEKVMTMHGRSKFRRESIRTLPINMDEDFVVPCYPKSDETVTFIDSALSDNFIFDTLSAEDRRGLIDAMSKQKISASTHIIEQGDIGDYFYVLEQGKVNFIVDGIQVGTCSRGACFGELALLYDSPRAATCEAAIDCVVWRADQRTFRYMIAINRANLKKDIQDVLKKVPFLSQLDESALSKINDALTPMKFKRGKKIVQKGSVGEIFYILREGTVKVHDIGLGDSQYADQILGPGDFFGERALLTGDRRSANVTAVTDCTVLCLSREFFEKTLGNLQSLMTNAMRKRTLMGVPIFANSKFESSEMTKLTELFLEQKEPEGKIIQKNGDPINTHALYIIESGSVGIVRNDGFVVNLRKGDHFGDNTIKTEEGKLSDELIAVKEEATFAVLTKSSIESVIGSISRIGQPQTFQTKLNRSPNFKHLKKLRILGSGAFGQVYLVSYKKSGKAYALKQIEKSQVMDQNQVDLVIRERNLMASIDHPFIVKLVTTFQDKTTLYMLIDFVQGGELFSIIHTETEDGIPNQNAQFYAACVLEGLSHMHNLSICYHDLKPENALIDNHGYCILIDLGFAKVVTDKTHTLCGTPEYLAPECILSKGHDKAADYWAFGVLIYEMLVGNSPFMMNGIDQMTLFKRIVETKPPFPRVLVNATSQDLISALLAKQPANRLGCLARGDKDIREYAWFKNINFKKLIRKECKAPWVPKVKNAFDASNFDEYEELDEVFPRNATLTKGQQELFKNF